MSGKKSNLKEAIDDLYMIFQAYPFEPNFAARCSSLGDRQEIAQRLTKAPLRKTDLEDMAVYTFKSMLTMGNERDFKHFLPRMCELLATNPEWFSWDTNLFSKLHRAGWHSWPELEQRVIMEFLQILWQNILENCPWHQPAHEVLAEFNEALEDLTPFLTTWEQAQSASAIRHLAIGVMDVYEDHIPQDLKTWLLSDRVKQHLEEAFFKFQEEAFAEDISQAIEWRG